MRPGAARRWLPRLLGPAALGVILLQLDLGEIARALGRVSAPTLAGAYLVVLPAFPLRSWRWKILLESQGAKLGALEALNAYAFSIVVGAATPGRLGELVKIAYLRRRRFPTTVAVWTVALDRLLDLAFLVMVGAAFLPAFAGGRGAAWALPALVVTAAVAVAGLRYALRGRAGRAAGRLAARLLPERASQRWLPAVASLAERTRALPASTLASVAILTALAWVVSYLSVYLCAVALGLRVPLLDVCGVTAVSSLVSFLPISILGLGTREASLIALLAPYGVPAPEAVALSALFLSLTFWSVLVCSYSLLSPAGLHRLHPAGESDPRRPE